MTTWGATTGHLRVGVDVTMSPSTVTASTTSVTLTWKVTVQTVQWYYADTQTATLSGAVSASKTYSKTDPQTTGTYSTVVGSWTSTVNTSTSTPITKALTVRLSDVVGGYTPSVSASYTVPQRPKATVATDTGTSSPSSSSGTTATAQVPSTSDTFQVSVATAKIWTKPTGGTYVATVTQGQTLTGAIGSDGWLYIDSGAYKGMVIHSSYVQKVAAAAAPTAPTTPVTPPPEKMVLPAPQDPPASMDLIPAPGSMLWGSDTYDAFPVTASHDKVVVTAWRHAVAHDVDRDATVMCATSTDGGQTYGPAWAFNFDNPVNCEAFAGGLAWDAKRKQFVLLVGWKRYADATSKTVVERYVECYTSPTDGDLWAPQGRIPTPEAAWFFVNELVIDGDLWIMGGYGRLKDGTYSRCLTTTSTDGGKTWTPTVEVKGVPDSTQWAEPAVTKLPSGGWVMMMRCVDDGANELHRAISLDGVTWQYQGLAVAGYTGNPELIALPSGVLVALMRTPQEPSSGGGYSLGRWAYGYSLDQGKTWSVRRDFIDPVRRCVYGGMALVGNEIALVYASEDDPDQPWSTASVWYTRFVTDDLIVSGGFVGPVSCIDVSTADRIPVKRVWTDPWTGEEVVDTVRWRTLDGYTSRDFEIQQGRTVYYKAGNRTTGKVTGPILPSIMLVHPLWPDTLSLPIEVVEDGEREYDLDTNETAIPGSPYWIVTKSGPRKVRSPKGSTTFRTRTLADSEKVLRLFEDGVPLFVSHHPGADFPDWVQPLSLKESRVAQVCGAPEHGHELGEWRTWTFDWRAVRRPSSKMLKPRRRIEELTLPIASLNLPIEDI